MPDITDINKLVKDSAYATIGFGVLGLQKAQVRRRELIEQLSGRKGQATHLSARFDGISDQVTARITHLGDQVGAQFGQLKTGSGVPVASMRTQLVEAAKTVDKQLAPVRQQVDSRLDEIEGYLPEPTRGVVKSIRDVAQTQEKALRSAIGLDA